MTGDPPPEADPAPGGERDSLWGLLSGIPAPVRVIAAAILVVLFAITVFVAYEVIRGDGTANLPPTIGIDHWHATYEIWICGEKQPDPPEWTSGVHTHGDGIIHIHPFDPAEEGHGAALGKFFEYGGGLLTADAIHLPGTRTTYNTGDTCRDGREAGVDVWVNGEPSDEFALHIPQDGDRIVISFGPEASVVIETPSPSPTCTLAGCPPTPAGPTPPVRY